MEKEVTVVANTLTDVSIQLSEAQTELAEVIISAGRTTETIDEVPSSVSIVGLKTLQQNINITSNLGDILEKRVSGLAPSTGLSSNFGQTLRGRSLLIMVDGVPQSTPLRNGAMDLRALDPAVIERVEVVKGATAIYGNGAAGGLINYFTRNARTNKLLNSQTSVSTTGSLVKNPNRRFIFWDKYYCLLKIKTSGQTQPLQDFFLFKISNADVVAIKTMIATKHLVIATIIADDSFVMQKPGLCGALIQGPALYHIHW